MQSLADLSPKAKERLEELQDQKEKLREIEEERSRIKEEKKQLEKGISTLESVGDDEEVFKASGPVIVRKDKDEFLEEISSKKEEIEERLDSLESKKEEIEEKAREKQNELKKKVENSRRETESPGMMYS